MLVAISTPVAPSPDEEAAFAAAIQDYFSDLLEYVPMEENGVVYESISLCVEGFEGREFIKLNRAFDRGKLVAFPKSDCRSETETNEFGHGQRPRYYDPNGIEAADVIVSGMCHSNRMCEVTVEEWFRVDRFKVVRIGPAWQVRTRENILLRD